MPVPPPPATPLTPDSLAMLQVIAETGSFAAAARQLGVVPSALTYRVRQIEEALDVLLFDRSARQARPTEAGSELLREGARLLEEVEAVAHRVRRVATGWGAPAHHRGGRGDLPHHPAGTRGGLLCAVAPDPAQAARRHPSLARSRP